MPVIPFNDEGMSDWLQRMLGGVGGGSAGPYGLTLGGAPSPSMQMTVMHHDPYSAAPTPFVGRQAPTLGKGYPSDFTSLYNSFAAEYAKHPAEVANERARGAGPWTSRMQQLDDLKDAQNWVRTDAPRLKRLPLGAQQNIYDTPDTPEGQVSLPPPDPSDPTGQTRARNYGEPIPPPANQYSPQGADIDRLFGNQIWRGYLGGGNPFSSGGGWGI